MGKFVKIAVMVTMAGTLAGCGETAFQDVFGAGKYSPDETQVQRNRALTTPPDLQLRPPGTSNPQSPPPVVQNQPPPGYAPPPQYNAPAGQQPPAYQPPPQTQPRVAAAPRQDVYARNGISRFHPDGRKKTDYELLEELRQLKLKRQREKNPNYGTVFNLPKVWADGG